MDGWLTLRVTEGFARQHLSLSIWFGIFQRLNQREFKLYIRRRDFHTQFLYS